jgi:hypothetical protein
MTCLHFGNPLFPSVGKTGLLREIPGRFDHVIYLCDFPVFHFQSYSQLDRLALLLDHAHESDLTCNRIRDINFIIVHPAGRIFPKPLADGRNLGILHKF